MPVCASSLSVVTFPSDRDASANRPHQTRFRINGARVGASAWNLKLPHGSPSMLCFYIAAWSSSLFANPVSIEAELTLPPGPRCIPSHAAAGILCPRTLRLAPGGNLKVKPAPA